MGEIAQASIALVGLDMAKNVVQVRDVDAPGRRVAVRACKREQFFAW